MNALVLGVVQDLRERRLWPVAIAMALALVAIPVLMLKPAESAPGAAAAPAAGAASSGVAGVPGPEEALAADKPLVSLAALDQPSDLKSFNSKNPFKPLESLASKAAKTDLASTGGAASGTSSTGGSGSGSGGSGGNTGGSSPSPVTPAPTPESPAAPQQKFVYAVDLTFESPKGVRHFRNLPRLRMLPDEASPLLVFLGVDQSGTSAVFLVDSTLKPQDGEGHCKPSRTTCATLSIEPGERQAFVDDQGDRYVIEIDQLRPVSLSQKASTSGELTAHTAVPAQASERRFVPPILVDLLIGGQP